jgi:hypothetical protein
MDIKDYSENELYELLNVMPSVSDIELEAKILEKIKLYRDDEETHSFFLKVYDVFFNEEFNNDEKVNDDEDTKIIENLENMDKKATTSASATTLASAPATASASATQVALTNPLAYSKDNLNPLLNQTITRIVSIDSQYRSPQYPYSTSFTFDLSDPLRDVVSLKLYSVQIPYTWYTINKDYGSNFFYLKATSPGLNNGNHDYIVDISAGNYSATNLVTTLSNSMQQNKTLYTDISFGITDISYNTFSSTSTITIEIQKIYNETSYYVYFPTFINPIENPSPLLRSYTLPGYLGYDSQSIPVNVIYSLNDVLPYKSVTANGDMNYSIYSVDTSNNYFNIIQYVGATQYDSNEFPYLTSVTDPLSTILQTITLQLSLPTGTYTRNQLQTNVNTQLQNNQYLFDSSLSRLDRTDAAYSYYNMTLLLNQTTTTNTQNVKLAVQFPSESTYTYPIWTGTNSCFYFDPTQVEVSQLTAEAELLISSFFITDTPTIHLQCVEPGYENVLNDFYITVQNAPNPTLGYTLTEYSNAINQGFTDASFTNSGFSFINSVPTLTFDTNTIFTSAQYGIDFTNSVLHTFYNMTYEGPTYSGNLPNPTTGLAFTGSLPIGAVYPIPVDASFNTIPPALITIYPQTTFGNANADPFIIPFVYTLSERTQIESGNLIYTNHLDIATDINRSISLFTDSNGDAVTSGTQFIYSGISGDSYTSVFTVNVFKNITQIGYDAILYDIVNGNPFFGTTNSWKKYLAFSQDSYDLSLYDIPDQPYSQIQGTLTVVGETLTLYDNSNNYFYIKPLPQIDGLYTTTLNPTFVNSYYNDIRIDIPAGTYNTTIELFSAINQTLSSNPLTRGSYITTTTIGTLQYTTWQIIVNKIFTANDFSIVFYDTVSFVKCYIGDSSVRNVTWDTTVGWILGFQEDQSYALSKYTDPVTNIATVTGSTSVNVNLYNYFLLSLDDFNQNRLNDGVVTITKNQINLPLPSYSSLSNFTCDICGNQISSGSTNVATNNLTLNQVYAINQVLNAQQNPPKTYTTGPFVKDVFAYIPMRVAGLQNGQTFVETSGQLQQQNRLYFGPVNIHRMQITLYTDKGTVVDLNGNNFSFSFVCEQLYQKQKI